jgi:NTE family protein
MKIGLALGSGAAKGWAHIGVIKALKKLGIQPDVVAGSSVGALVGAAYASGQLEALEQWLLGMSNIELLTFFDVNLSRGSIISGDKLFDKLEDYFGTQTIEDLEIALGIVATDLYRGDEVWFRQGHLLNAIRASCAIPGIFAPVKHQHRWLIDGAVTNPLPVSLCRAMGADLIIGVDLHTQLKHVPAVELKSFKKSKRQKEKESKQRQSLIYLLEKGKEQIETIFASLRSEKSDRIEMSMLAVMTQALDILEYRHKRTRLMGDPPDVCITPVVPQIQTLEFHRSSEAIVSGEASVAQIEHILKNEIVRIDPKFKFN